MSTYYSIIKDDKIVFGPIPWNPAEFSRFLFSEGIQVSFPNKEFEDKMLFINGFILYPTTVVKANLTPDQKVISHITSIETNMVYYTEVAGVMDEEEINTKLEELKVNLRNTLKFKRIDAEQNGLTIKVGDKLCIFDTDRDSQGMLHRTYDFMIAPVSWKLKDNVTWVTLDKETMLYVIQNIAYNISESFRKEDVIQNLINGLDVFEAVDFDINAEWEVA